MFTFVHFLCLLSVVLKALPAVPLVLFLCVCSSNDKNRVEETEALSEKKKEKERKREKNSIAERTFFCFFIFFN